MTNKLEQFRQKFQCMSLDERKDYLKKLSKAQKEALYCNPDLFLFEKQIISGDYRYIILRCGRRFGKSVAGSAFIAKKIRSGHKHLALCGATYGDVRKIMVPNILKWFTPEEKKYITYNGELHTLNFEQFGAIVYCHTSDKEIRGFSVSALWCDELGSWCDDGTNPDKVLERFNILDTTVSESDNPQTVITSTPKPFPMYFDWQKKIDQGNTDYLLVKGNMDDNPFLSAKYKRIEREKYLALGKWGMQEFYGELNDAVEGAAWTQEMIDKCHITQSEFKNLLHHNIPIVDFKASLSGIKTEQNQKERFYMARIDVSVDPTVSDKPAKDECGLVVAGVGSNGHVYVFSDRSDKMDTLKWAQEALIAVSDYGAGCIVIEDNIGKDVLIGNIRMLDHNVMIKPVTAKQSKIDRALPVSALYARGLVHHIMPDNDPSKPYVNPFEKLEYQMTHFTGNPKEKSPDRLDALVWAVYDLKLTKTYQVRDFSALGSY